MLSDLFTPAALSVSELNAIAAELLENQLSGLWIGGEISNLTRATSGHFYFSLKDSTAQVRCVLFKQAAARLAKPLREGDHVEVRGKISLYQARGEFQITVNEVRQVGLGQLFERYERLKMQLQNEGLFAAERKKSLPENPKRIGVVTSLTAAALRDVLTTLRRRAPHIPVIVYPTPVQGAGSEHQIAQAIQAANERAEVDVQIVCRGGGSIEDLWAFNEEVVVRAIAACDLPIVSGVGHETDFTLSDFVADVRAPTPTGAAELVSPNREEMLAQLARTRSRLHEYLLQRYQKSAQTLDFLAQRLQHPRDKCKQQQAQLAQLHAQLGFAMKQQLAQTKHAVVQSAAMLPNVRPNVAQLSQRVLGFQAALSVAQRNALAEKHQRVLKQAELLEAMSPNAVLQRGFAIVRNTRGQVVHDASDVKQGQKLNVMFAQGVVDAQVLSNTRQKDLFE
ncbi:exodeoxyribonuclease VII large subunit [Kingella negevensis]|uniref:exodeoxyribonuclease VII large subunit n=1 Tax=Kingella negevensis TaxID=1522312 RepID=UPI0025432AC5|nr:exodeoxyribonuclease VII large subunit [Kingella negevensis]MDK4680495.1 exodeoxyribonuclease VII large subunit [Kingella negevensis]MDK4681782.1 exodeoxyribonuclease VII large subunit [Kingella negevensis]MDK4689979.1 exodeoxyribonuclease VII large subunit [Kingella negevensis]MDK4692676.1 exodeoxyribonuclease VII large subunit [Kingella negevensis]MDK4698975.1 exodeoxyribonuclease VII large subunit [Kingella negevensis]